MCHPFRRFSYMMAEKLNLTLPEVQTKLSSHEMSEWMAYHLTKDEDWVKQYQRNEEMKKSREMSDAERLEAFKKLLDGKKTRK